MMEVMTCAFGDRFGEAWTRSQLAGILPMAGVALDIACDSRSPETIGFSLFRTVAEESELLLIAVRPERHREGIGRRLLDHFMDQARHCGVARVHLEVRDGNPAIQMYREAGFRAGWQTPQLLSRARRQAFRRADLCQQALDLSNFFPCSCVGVARLQTAA